MEGQRRHSDERREDEGHPRQQERGEGNRIAVSSAKACDSICRTLSAELPDDHPYLLPRTIAVDLRTMKSCFTAEPGRRPS